MKVENRTCPKCGNSRTQRHCGSTYCVWRMCLNCTRSLGNLVFNRKGKTFIQSK